MKIDLQIQCRLSFVRQLKIKDTHELPDAETSPGEPCAAWFDEDDPRVEHAQVVTSPGENIAIGQILIVARGVSIELNIREFAAAIAALKAVEGIPHA